MRRDEDCDRDIGRSELRYTNESTEPRWRRSRNHDEDEDGTTMKASKRPLRFDHDEDADGDWGYGKHEYTEEKSPFSSFFWNTKTEKMEMENEALEIWDVRAKEEEKGFFWEHEHEDKKNVRLFFF